MAITPNVQPFPDSTRQTMQSARNGAPAGQRKQAMGAAGRNVLGATPVLWFEQDGVKVVEVTFTTPPTVADDGSIVLGPRAWSTLVLLQTALRSRGTWLAYITNAARTAGFIINIGGSNAAAALTADLQAGGGFALGDWKIGFDPAYDPTIITPSLAANDSRNYFVVDPSLPWNSQPGWSGGANPALVQAVAFPNQPLSAFNGAVTTASTIDGSSLTLIDRVEDPDHPGRWCHRHQLHVGQGPWAGSSTYRSEISTPDGSDAPVCFIGTSYWVAYSFRLDTNMIAPGATAVSILDLHAPYPSNNGGPSPISVMAGAAGITPWRRYDDVLNGNNPEPDYPLPSIAVPSLTWIHTIHNFRLGYQASQNPFWDCWFAQGDDGAMTKMISSTDLMGFNESNPWQYLKHGLYNFSGSQFARRMWTKGIRMLRDQPGSVAITAANLLALQRSL